MSNKSPDHNTRIAGLNALNRTLGDLKRGSQPSTSPETTAPPVALKPRPAFEAETAQEVAEFAQIQVNIPLNEEAATISSDEINELPPKE